MVAEVATERVPRHRLDNWRWIIDDGPSDSVRIISHKQVSVRAWVPSWLVMRTLVVTVDAIIPARGNSDRICGARYSVSRLVFLSFTCAPDRPESRREFDPISDGLPAGLPQSLVTSRKCRNLNTT